MGIFDRRRSAQLTRPLDVELPAWSQAEALRSAGLSEGAVFDLAVMRGALQVDVSRATTSWLADGGRHSIGEVAATTTSALLQVEGGLQAGTLVSLGSADPMTRYIEDWTMLVRRRPGQATFEVLGHRTSDGRILNEDVLVEVRQAIIDALQAGPSVDIVPGPPSFDGLIEPAVLGNASSIFADDHLLPPPAGFRSGARIDLPAGGAEALAQALDENDLPQERSDGADHRVVPLGGGRDVADRLLIGADAAGDHVLIEVPDFDASTGLGRHRTLRAGLVVLARLERKVRKSDAAVADALRAFLDDCRRDEEADDRVDRFVPVWGVDAPQDAIRLGRSMALPVGLLLRARNQVPLSMVLTAQSWLTVRERTWARGVRRAAREKSRIYTARRAAFGGNDDAGRTLRYAHVVSNERSSIINGDPDATWFWQVSGDALDEEGGVISGLLRADGLSSADGYLAYGTELAALLRAVAWTATTVDPEGEVDTIVLELDR